VDNAKAAALTAGGLAHLASKMGLPVMQYRPESALTPRDTVYATAMMYASDSPALRSGARSQPGDPYTYAAFSSSDIAAGDLLIGASGTWVVCRNDGLSPLLCVECNHTISVLSSASSTGSATVVAADWPVAIMLKSRGDRSQSGTPGAITPGEFALYSAAIPGVALLPYMAVESEDGLIYTVDTVETSRFGWRALLSVQQV